MVTQIKSFVIVHQDHIMEEFPFRVWELLWYLCIFIVGTIGNSSVIIVIVRIKKIDCGALINILILTLAIVDMIISIIGLPIYILQTDLFYPESIHGNLVCIFVNFPQFWLLDVVIYLLTAISLERRKAIVDPLSVLDTRPKWQIAVTLTCCFSVAALAQAPTIIGAKFTIVSQASVGNYCRYSYTYLQSTIIYFVVLAVETVLPLVVILVCFRHIWVKLKESDGIIKNAMAAYENDSNFEQKKNIILERKASAIAVWKIVILVFIVCIIPNNVLYCIFKFFKIHTLRWNSVPYQIGLLLRFSNSCINPFLYNFLSKEFRQHFKDVFRNCKCNADLEHTTPQSLVFVHRTGDYKRLKNNSNIII